MADTTTIVIFGASGDLTRRKLIPALFSLYRKRRLPAGIRVVRFAVAFVGGGSVLAFFLTLRWIARGRRQAKPKPVLIRLRRYIRTARKAIETTNSEMPPERKPLPTT